jgi:hypothetical protein
MDVDLRAVIMSATPDQPQVLIVTVASELPFCTWVHSSPGKSLYRIARCFRCPMA